jgi:hypothetical protein
VTGSAKQDSDASLTVGIALEAGPISDDITNTEVTEIKIFSNTLGIEKIWYRCETTQEVEFSQYQPSPTQVCFAGMEPWDSRLYLNGQNPETDQRIFLTVVDDSIEEILEEILLRIFLASQYYFYTSLPFPSLSARPLPSYCGLSPGGLSHGIIRGRVSGTPPCGCFHLFSYFKQAWQKHFWIIKGKGSAQL